MLTAFSNYLHGSAHDLIALLSFEILSVFVLYGSLSLLFTLSTLKHLKLLSFLGRDLISSVAGNCALDIVELSKSFEGDDALLVIFDSLGSLGLGDTATLVLGEDVGGAGDLGSRTTLALGLFQLLKVAVVEARLACGLRVFTTLGKILVETVTDTLSEGIDASVAASLALLITYALVVVVGVEGACTL